jgi:hypothetical protein
LAPCEAGRVGISKQKGGLVAKKSRKKSPKEFMTEVATDPEKLGKFILDPEAAMDEAKITKKERIHIKNALAHYVHEKLVKPPQAYFVI